MKKRCLLFLLVPFLTYAQAQEKGVHFEHGLSWAAIQAKAKAEHKYIFMDCFTTWCGPCRFMSNTIFPQEASGSYFNEKFINVKVQLDTTKNDNDEVKSWYADGHTIMQQYHINAFPTFLVFAPDGQAVHRIVGGSQTPQEFIARVNTSFDPDKQYYTLLNQYQGGKKDPAFLRKLALAAQEAYDMQNAAAVSAAYLHTLSEQDLYKKENLEFISKFTRSSKDKGFALLLNNPAKVDALIGQGKAEQQVLAIICRENIYPRVFKKDAPAPDWDGLQKELAQQYPRHAAEAIAQTKVFYYENKKDWTGFQQAIVQYMKQYGANASPEQLNQYAWTVFQNCPDMNCVAEALEWSKRSFKDKENPMFMDTYANILYKMGKKTDAIAWEEKALNLAPDGDKKTYQDTLDKMKKGEKTWD